MNMNRRESFRKGSLLLSAALILVLFSTSWADMVELKTGQRIEGTFKQATDTGVVIEVGGQLITFRREQVRAIYLGSSLPSDEFKPKSASLAQEALGSLKTLQSVVSSGINYQNYVSRVADAKVQIDRYIQEPVHQDETIRQIVKDAMDYYVLASLAWSARIRESNSDYVNVARNPLLSRCSKIQEFLSERRKDPMWQILLEMDKTPTHQQVLIGEAVGESGIPLLWSCAADRTATAGALLDEKQK